MKTADKKAGGGLPPTTGRDIHLSAGVAQNATPTISPTTDSRRWEPFDVWLKRYERATGADAWHSSIPGGPRGWR